MLILIPTLGAIIGTAWSALIGGVAGTVVLALLTSVTLCLRYLYYGGDADWTGVYGGAVPGLMSSELHCKAEHPIHPNALGAMSCVLKPTNGQPVAPERSGLRVNPMGASSTSR
jgi:hypothetical protein